MEFGALGLRQSFVRRVADQDVTEPVRVAVGEGHALRADDVFALECVERVARALARERNDRVGGEEPADDGCDRERVAFCGRQELEARCEQRVDRRRHRIGRVLVDDHRDKLFEEERVALCGLGDRLPARVVEAVAGEVRNQPVGVLGVERLEEDRGRVRLAAAPRRPLVEQLGPRQAQKQDGRLSRGRRDVVDHVEHRRRAPVDVLEDEDERPFAGDRLEQPPNGARRLLGCGGKVRCAHRGLEDRGVGPIDVSPNVAERVHDLAQRPERDPLAVRKASSDEQRSVLAERVQELAPET